MCITHVGVKFFPNRSGFIYERGVCEPRALQSGPSQLAQENPDSLILRFQVATIPAFHHVPHVLEVGIVSHLFFFSWPTSYAYKMAAAALDVTTCQPGRDDGEEGERKAINSVYYVPGSTLLNYRF